MKKNLIKGFLLYFIAWLIAFFLFISVGGCRSADYHLDKFQKKGGKIECKGDTTYIERVIKGKDGKDSIIYEPIIEYRTQIEYQTRWKTRFDNKRFNDSLKHIERIYSDSLKYALRTAKINKKTYLKRQKDADEVRKLIVRKTATLQKHKQKGGIGHLTRLLIILGAIIFLIILALKKLLR